MAKATLSWIQSAENTLRSVGQIAASGQAGPVAESRVCSLPFMRRAALGWILVSTIACGEDPVVEDVGAASDSGVGADAGDGGVRDVGPGIDASDDGGVDAGLDAGPTDDGVPLDLPAVVINELMYHPSDSAGPGEFLELYNAEATPVVLDGWRLGGFGLSFPTGTTMAPGAYLVVAESEAGFTAAYGRAPDLFTTGHLDNGGERIELFDADGNQVDVVEYDDAPPWPITPDGEGLSLELVSFELDNNLARSWRAGGPTPGAVNSVFQSQALPYVVSVSAPRDPAPDTSIAVVATIEDADSAELYYRIDFGPTATVAMSKNGDQYQAEIPGQSAATLVRFHVRASGPNGSADWPRSDDSVYWDGLVVADPSVSSQLPIFHWFMAPDQFQFALDNRFEDLLWPAVFYYDGRLYDDVRVRIKGDSSRAFQKNHWKFKFPRGHDFDIPGVLRGPLDQFNLQSSYADKSYMRDLLGYETLKAAGMPYNSAFHVRVQQNGQFFGLYTFVQDMDGEYLDQNGYGDGAWYECGADASPLALGEIENLYEKAAREDEPHDDLVALLQAIDEGNPNRAQFFRDRFDIPNLINYLAVNVIMHANDQASKNYYLYHDVSITDRWSLQAWDMDLIYGRNFGAGGDVLGDLMWADDDLPDPGRPWVSPSHPLFGDRDHQKWDEFWNRLIDAAHADPELRQMFYRRLRTLMDSLLAGPFLEQYFDAELAKMAPEAALDQNRWGYYGLPLDLDQAASQILDDYLPRRRTHLFTTHRVQGEIPEAQGAQPNVVITELHYNPSTAPDHEFVELYNPSATEAVDVSGWRVNGLDLVLPPGSVILPQAYVVVVKADQRFRAARGGGRLILATYPDVLADAGEPIELVDPAGRVVDSVPFAPTAPWPTTPNGTGPSLELRDVNSDNSQGVSWGPSLTPGGTPAARNSIAN